MPRAFAPLVVFVLTGCYSYAPLASPSPEPGTYLAADLTAAGATELAPLVGPEAATLRGRVLDVTTESLALAVFSVRLRSGGEVNWEGETVRVPAPLVAGLRERRLARTRTILFVGVLTLGVGAVVGVATGIVGGSDGGGEPPPGQ